jgi:hypothetical protein
VAHKKGANLRRVLVVMLMLAGIVLLFSGARSPSATAQTQGVLWINDNSMGKGIYELALDSGKLQLLIPSEKLEFPVLDMAVDSQGQIFFLVGIANQGRILKATPTGGVSTVVEQLPLFDSVAMAVDAQGNFIVVDDDFRFGKWAIFRVDPKGQATQVARIICTGQSSVQVQSLLVDQNEDYIVAANCATPVGGGDQRLTGQLLRVTPAGEVSVILNAANDPRFGGALWDVEIDPAGSGYYVSGRDNRQSPYALSDLYRVTPAGQVTFITEDWPIGDVGDFTIAPSGDLFLLEDGGVTQFFTDGSRKVLSRDRRAPLILPTNIQWVGK